MVILRQQKRKEKKVTFLNTKKYEEYCQIDDIKNSKLNSNNEYEYGIAVDIGTTTVAMTVFSFVNKCVVGECSETNEQTKLGADVMMRIMHAGMGKSSTLHQMIISQIEHMANQFVGEEHRTKKVCFFVVGNTTMCHLFLGQNVSGLAGAPFTSAYQGNYRCTGKDIGMKCYMQAKICVLSGIYSHVGSDTLALIGAKKMQYSKKVQLAIDLGTNAEIVLNDGRRLSVCSTAAGPAFEGKGISSGMAAKCGAVNGVKIAPNNGNIILEIIDSAVPKGICGSGLVDVLSQLLKCQVLTSNGYLLSSDEANQAGIHPEICNRLKNYKSERVFELYKDLYVTQGDIRNLQLAKGAIQAGVISILNENSILLQDVDEVIIAGVLGSCLRMGNAVGIGLFPGVEEEKFVVAGNAASEGAMLGLLYTGFALKLEETAKTIRHIELAKLPQFNSILMDSMDFKVWK